MCAKLEINTDETERTYKYFNFVMFPMSSGTKPVIEQFLNTLHINHNKIVDGKMSKGNIKEE